MGYEEYSLGLITICPNPECGYMVIESANIRPAASYVQDGHEARYVKAGIGQKYLSAKADCSEVLRAIQDEQNVFIVGGNGTGKSSLAAAAAMKLIDEGVDVLFANAAIAAERVKDDFNDGELGYLNRMCEAAVLVLDDFGKGYPSEWSVSLWYTVMEARNSAKIPTIVTTNYDGGSLVSRLKVNGDDSSAKAIVSRMRGGALVVKMDGVDRRLCK